ncbi:MAG TPA: amino acid permease [Burkholderiaceae bacterium]|nr:amino acid permease [Burkholderiaceae bacterium]
MSDSTRSADQDAEQLKALGYTSRFDRKISLWQNFSLGFTYLSPVVGVYTLFATSFAAGGPAYFWSYLLVALGQLLVVLVFGEIVSQFPISGGLYPWARRLVGKRWAWMAGWVYAWALFVTVSGTATGAAPFVAQLLGIEVSPAATTAIAIALIVGATLLNLGGTRLLARVAMFGFICELIGAIVVGLVLLLFARHQPWSAVFDSYGIRSGGHYWPAFLAASVAAMFCYYGFEACGDVAEETPDASRAIPKAMRMTIYVGAFAAMLVCLALVLAVPDVGAVLQGKDKDPVVTTLRAAMGEFGFRAVIAVVLVSFASCLLSLQAATSRLLFAYGRDEMIVGSRYLSQLSPHTHIPTVALILSGLVPALIALSGLWLQNAVATIISFAAIGIYIAFFMIVLAALIARLRGWQPAGPFSLGAFGWVVNLAALAYQLVAIFDMAWPRSPDDPWYSNYSMIVTTVGVLVLGFVYMLLGRPYDRGNAPAGDAPALHLPGTGSAAGGRGESLGARPA